MSALETVLGHGGGVGGSSWGRSTENSAFHLAAFAGHVPAAAYLVRRAGAEVRAKGENGNAPLQAAGYGGHVALIEYLQVLGAEVEQNAANGFQALHLAAIGGHVVALAYLVERAGAEVFANSEAGASGRQPDLQDRRDSIAAQAACFWIDG